MTAVLGVDPGGTSGLAVLWFDPSARGKARWRVEVAQVSGALTLPVVDCLLRHCGALHLAVERFVVGPRAARSSSASAGALTRSLVGALEGLHREVGQCEGPLDQLTVHSRSASQVKPWATDARLDAAGLLEPTAGMRHARDAVRHALFCAVRDCGLPDPLSRKA